VAERQDVVAKKCCLPIAADSVEVKDNPDRGSNAKRSVEVPTSLTGNLDREAAALPCEAGG
jgi:hypothetical protein